MRRLAVRLAVMVGALGGAATASAQTATTTTYTYDSRGHLTEVEHTGGVNGAVVVAVAADAVDNRTQRTVTGRSKPKAVIVPLGKLLVVPLP